MRYADVIIDGYNAIAGAIVAVLSYILGEHWILFVAFLFVFFKNRKVSTEDYFQGWEALK